MHANQYYSLDVEIFKSELDDELLGKLWNKYWINTLSSSPLISVRTYRIINQSTIDCWIFFPLQNRAYAVSQLTDLHNKLSNAQKSIPSTRPTLPPHNKASTTESAQPTGPTSLGPKGKVLLMNLCTLQSTFIDLHEGEGSREERRKEGRWAVAQECQRRVRVWIACSGLWWLIFGVMVFAGRGSPQRHSMGLFPKFWKTLYFLYAFGREERC